MLKRSSLLLITSLFIFAHVTTAQGSSLPAFTALSAEADPHTGSANFGVPIEVPPGRAGVQPNIQLHYNSSAPNGILGVGWNLELGSIQRSGKGGVPHYDDTDTLVLIQNGGAQELVLDAGTGLYRGKVEGAFMKIARAGGHWEVTDKSGVRYFFGETQGSQEYDPADGGRIFKWCLNRVEDGHGNEMTVTYFRDENMLYPQEIAYTGNPARGLAAFARVVFERELRPENTIDRYNAGFRMSARYRINRITASVSGDLQRKYDLVYDDSRTTGRSLLTSIAQYGSDGFSSLPPVTFSYQTPKNPDFNYAVTPMNSSVAGDNLWNYRYAGSYDRGPNNYGSVPPGGFDVSWGPVYTQSSGGNWNINSKGNLTFSAGQDSAHWFWTYLYIDGSTPKTLTVPYSTEGVDGIWITQNYGTNAHQSWTLQPGYNLVEMTFYNQNQGFGFNLNYDLADGVNLMSSSTVVLPQLSGDFNADGRSDIATFTSSSGKVAVERSSGTSFAPKETWASGFAANVKLVLGDFNGDGRMDIGGFDPAGGNWRVGLSDGGRFNDAGVWLPGFGANEEPSSGDFNGDGLADILTFYKASGNLYVRIALNKGGSFAALSGGQNILIGSEADVPIVGDFNGDGQIDFGAFNKAGGNWNIRLNTGDILSGLRQLPGVTGFGANRNTVVSDFNYDGLTDIGYYDDATGKVVYRVSKGLSFAPAVELPFVFNIKGPNTQIQSGDYNGDTLIDFAVYNLIGKLEIAFSNGVMPDILSSVENGLGGESSITYNAAVNYPQTFLPFPIQVVKSITQSNGLGESYTINNSYEQGLWDAQKREFRGFGLVRTTDPDGNYSETVFAQDGIYKGRVTEQRTYDSSGKLYGKTLHTWAYEEVAAGSNFIYLKRKDNFVYDGDATGRRTAEEFFFGETPQMGNLTKAVQLGEVDLLTGSDIGNDTRAVETAYVQNTSGGSWIVGLPRQTTVKDNAGNIVRQAWFYYDNQGNTTAPVKGLLTKKEDWAGTGQVNPVTQYTYDTVGNLLTTTDPKGNITRVTYDTAYQMFPLTTENALGHKVTNEYYGVNGVVFSGGGFSGLWGQVKSTTDPNQQQGKRSYDVFGRAVAAVSPLDSVAFPTQTTSIEFLGSYTKVTTRQRVEHGKAATVDAVSFIDGFGRLAQTKARSEVTGRYVVNGQARYDSRGLKSRQFLPAFSTNPMDVIDVIDNTKPHTLITYDAMGRPVRTTNPDGTFASVSYDDWAATATDENGHRQRSYFDAYGRLIKKEEYLGADGRSPYYPGTPTYTLYATTLYSYDSEGNLVQTKDAYNNITTITYDALGRKVAMDDPDMGRWSYQYDLNGNLTKQIDAKGQTLTFTYDALNRLTNKTDGISGTVNVNYTYDNTSSTNSKGRLTQAAYTGGNTQFAYDELGRELQSIKAMNTKTYSVNRQYDALNNLAQIQYPDQKGVSYKYNAAGQIEAVTNDPTLVPPVTLNAPELGVIQASNAQVKLTWGSVTNATGYKVKYGLTSGTYTVTLDVGNVLSSIVTGLTNGTTYYFTVVACDVNTESSYSNERSATPEAPLYPSTQLLLLFDDQNTSTTITDISVRHIIAARGDARIDTAMSKVGEGSLWLDGTGDFLQSDDSSDWDVVGSSTQDWTIDLWVKHEGLGSAENYMTHFEDSANYWEFSHVKGTGIRFRAVTNGSSLIELAGGEITDTSWHHIAFIKVGDRYGIYKDGIQVVYLQSSNTANFTGPLYIGSQTSTAKYFSGHMDNVRIAAGNIFGALPGIDEVPGPDINWSVYPGATTSGTVTQGTAKGSPDYLKDNDESTSYGAGDYNYMGSVAFSYSATVILGQEVKTVNKLEVPCAFFTNSWSSGSYQVDLFYDGSWHSIGGSSTVPSGVLVFSGPWHNVTMARINVTAGGGGYRHVLVQHETFELRVWGPQFYTYPPNDRIVVPLGQENYIVLFQRNFEEFDVNRKLYLAQGALGNQEIRDTNDERLDTQTFLSAIGSWLERHVLGVSDAYAQAALPPPWIDQDIGSVGVAGSAGYASGAFTVKGSGSDIYNASDSFHFVYQALNGDGEIVARVDSVQNTYSWAKAGVMMRENLTAGSRNAFMLMSATQGAAFQRRKSPASSTSNTSGGTSLRAPYWVKLVRTGNTFTAYKSVDGMAWTQVGPTETITMTQTIYIGLAVTSHANTVLNTSLFSGVQVSTGLAAPVLNTATAGNGEVSLSWSAAAGAAGYRIYYGIGPGVTGTVVMDVLNTTSATVRNLTNGTTYYFTVRAYNPAGEGTRSNEMSATPVAPPPPADTTAPGVPGGVTAAAASTSQIDISWNASTDNVGVAGYRIYRDGAQAGTSATTGYADTGLSAGTTYSYTVSAYDAASNQSAQSGAVNATTPGGGSGAEIIIDDTAAQRAGSWGGPSTSMPNYYQTGYYWNGTKTGTQNIVWRPTIAAAGNYEVFYWLPNGTGTRPTDARYEIFYDGGSVTKTVNQQEAGGAWKSLGTYPFAAGTNGYVRLNVLTNSGQYTIGDAVKFVAVTAPPPPAVTLTAIPATITAGESAALTWSSTNADACTASGGWSGSKAVSGTANVTPSLTTVYTLTCAGPGGSASASAEVTVNPLVVQETPTLYIKNVDYNAAGQMTKVEYGNGDVTTYAYNPLNLRLTRLYTVDKNGAALQDLNYTYDSAGNILSIDDKVNTADQTFKYDELNRLTEAAGQGYGTKTYVYDTIGNIVQKDGKTYFYGDGAAAGPHAVTSLSDGTTFTYDANGNLTQQTQSTQSTQYTYDAENRLVKVTKNGSTVGQYEYDGDGGRTKKTATVSGATTTTTFVGSLFETSGARSTKFIFLGGQRVAAVTNSPSIGSTTLYYHADHLGGANVLTDATGFKKELIEYEPFGQESRHEKYGSNEEVAWYYFTGKPKDDETGLIYFGARYYDPKLGRFIQADPIVAYPGNPQNLNRYSYVHNNPVNLVDPTGNFAWFVPFLVAAIKGAAIGAAVGAGVAAVTGGDIGRGALFGAITGGAFAGFGSLAQSAFRLATIPGGIGPMTAGATSASNFIGGVVGGAAGGAAGSAFLGADPLEGAGIGALSGGLFGGISGMKGTGWAGVGRVALAGIAGGGISELAGGSFLDGFIFASSVASADFIYRAILASAGERQGSSMKTATQNGAPKQDANGHPINGGNEIALHVDLGKNHVGNPSRSSYVKNSKEFWLNFLTGETGPVMNTLGRGAPGFQGLSLAHDQLGYLTRRSFGNDVWKYFGNFETMAPVYGINVVGSLINDNPSSIGIYIKNGRDL